MGNMFKIGIADLNVCKAPDAITTLGLGSCVGVALYDKTTKTAGLVHVMLPDSTAIRNSSNAAKFADTGVDELVKQMLAMGINKRNLVAKIAGGAKMFSFSDKSKVGNVGERNVQAVKERLKMHGIRLIAEDTGLDYGRTVEIYADSGDYHIKAVGKTEKVI
ncbi:MAG: chemotaxis protein CheD [Eubacterium sp.]|nr:chemotaxis protein CheD [Eubacterium sp.]